MRHRRSLYALLAGLVVCAALWSAITLAPMSDYSSALSQALSSLVATPIHHYGAEAGPITATLISPDDVTLQVLSIQKEPTMWLFHIHAHNNAQGSVSILDAATSHYFDLGLRGTVNKPYTWNELNITLTATSTVALDSQAALAAYPALSATVAPGADSDGWLVANLATTTYPPFELLYVYGTVTAPACTNPNDQSTCHPSTGYRTLVWRL
jgi:hypothetical protein